ncbi:hypothetical protein ACIQU6_20935 [Streptomyces sp. NPDC090442]|uniref:hypothetical protein n=1 Tax=Streptomyces sp. NPDC090442 TaxID=3365962 RepID=UPI00381E6057
MIYDDDHLRGILRELDDPEAIAFPRASTSRPTPDHFEPLIRLLEARFQCVCEADRGVRDASFRGTVVLPSSAVKSRQQVIVRLSNFGPLTTAGAGGLARDGVQAVERLHKDDQDRIAAASAELGCAYTPGHLLRERYDGGNLEDWQTMWWHSYFDYM